MKKEQNVDKIEWATIPVYRIAHGNWREQFNGAQETIKLKSRK